MKLITETTFDDLEYDARIDESTGKKQWHIKGIYAQAETPNRNGRVYPKHILEREMQKHINEYVKKNRALGELNHPKYIKADPKKASHRVTEIIKEGNDYIGDSIILNTPEGKIVSGLLEGGTQLGVSTRGAGSLTESKRFSGIQEVCEDYMLSTHDIVIDPSGIDCFVNGIYEGVEWVWQDDKLVEVAETSKKLADQNKVVEAFQHFINSIKA